MTRWTVHGVLEHMSKLEKIIQIQLIQLEPFFRKSVRVNQLYKNIIKHYKGKLSKEEQNTIFQFCMLKKLSVMRVTDDEKYLSSLVCYDKNGVPMVELRSIITKGSHVRLVNGRLLDPALEIVPQYRTTPECVVKIYYSEKHGQIRTCDFEVQVYEEMGCPSPYIPIEAYIWNGARVLIMKKMSPLHHKIDDGHEVGIQILPQLQQVFELPRTHSDIKPENIMAEPSDKEGERIYKLIDFQGCTKKWGKRKGTLERRTYSPHWTSQSRNHEIDTTAKNDLIELGYTMNSLVGKRKYGSSDKFDVKQEMQSNRLIKYMDHVDKLPNNHFAVTRKVMMDLQNILLSKHGGKKKKEKYHHTNQSSHVGQKSTKKLSARTHS